jgi:hypothetical protein
MTEITISEETKKKNIYKIKQVIFCGFFPTSDTMDVYTLLAIVCENNLQIDGCKQFHCFLYPSANTQEWHLQYLCLEESTNNKTKRGKKQLGLYLVN